MNASLLAQPALRRDLELPARHGEQSSMGVLFQGCWVLLGGWSAPNLIPATTGNFLRVMALE